MQDVQIVLKNDVGEYVGMTRPTKNSRKLFLHTVINSFHLSIAAQLLHTYSITAAHLLHSAYEAKIKILNSWKLFEHQLSIRLCHG